MSACILQPVAPTPHAPTLLAAICACARVDTRTMEMTQRYYSIIPIGKKILTK